MVNDFIGTIVDRFNNINAIHANVCYAGIYIDIGIIDDAERHIISCAYFYNESLSVYIYPIYPLDGDASLSMFINYNEFTDIDEFIGMILCKAFYD